MFSRLMLCLLGRLLERLDPILIESRLPLLFLDGASGEIFQDAQLLQYVRHMNLLLQVLVVLVQNPLFLAHFAAAGTVDLAICQQDVPDVPLDAVTLLEDLEGLGPLQLRHLLEALLLCIEHVFHQVHMMAIPLEKCDDYVKYDF